MGYPVTRQLYILCWYSALCPSDNFPIINYMSSRMLSGFQRQNCRETC